MEDARPKMPKWLISVLSWGGAAVAILSAAALILVRIMAPTSAAPVTLYWYGLFVGVVAASSWGDDVAHRRHLGAGGSDAAMPFVAFL